MFEGLNSLIHSGWFPWYWDPCGGIDPSLITDGNTYLGDNVPDNKEIRNSISFHHTPLHRDSDQSLDTPYRSVKSIISASDEKFGIEVSKIIRCRMNLTCPVPNFGPDNYNVPHVDWPDLENYFTLLYYLDDSDGDTFIFNEHYKDGFPKTVTIDRRISPKSNMALLMDGWKYHASSNPVKSNQRITINFNVELK